MRIYLWAILGRLAMIAWTTWPAWLSALLASICTSVLISVANPADGPSPAQHQLRPSPLSPHDYDRLLQQAARRHLPTDVDWRLLKAIMWKESSFNPRARSPAGALGLMQLMPATARSLGLSPQQALQPAANIDAAARYMATMLDYWAEVPNSPTNPERVRLALASYNWGIGNVRKAVRQRGGRAAWDAIRDGAPRETRDYVQRIVHQRLPREQSQDHRPGSGPGRPGLPLPPLFARPLY